MKIKLKNFKQHIDKEVELPDSGLVMLKGRSGAGKSTIFEAVEDTLYGSAKKIKSWSGGRPETFIELDGFAAHRTRTPNTITYKQGSIELEGGAAQDAIISKLNMKHSEFMACSYIKQSFSNSILDMTPKDMLRFIEDLSSKDESPEDFKKKISARISELKSELDKASSAYESSVKMLTSVEDLTEPVKPDFEYSEEGHKKELQAERDRRAKIIEMEFEFNQLYKKYKEFTEKQESHKEIENRYKELESELSGLQEPDPDFYSKREIRKQEVYKKNEYFNKYEALMSLANEFHLMFPEAKKYKGKLTSFIEESMDKLELAKKDISTEIYKKTEEIKKVKFYQENSLICPSCDAPLIMKDDELHHWNGSDESSEDRLKQLEREVIELEDATKKMDKSLKFMKNTLVQAQTLKAEMPDPSHASDLKSRADVQDAIDNLNSDLHNYIESKEKYESVKKSFDEAKMKYEYSMEVIKNPITQEEVMELKRPLDELKAEQLFKRKTLSDLDAAEKAHNAHQIEMAKYNQYLESKKKMTEEMERSHSKLQQAHQKYAAAVRLKEVADTAANAAVISKINEINESAAPFIERMFSDDGTVIQLSNINVTQKGKENAQISVEVFHKGKEIKGINEFSGGEKSRACLAFQLGLSNLYGSPILMIDEGFTGLDSELQEECIEVLREFAEDTLVLVIEHGAPEHLFDKVIEI